MKRSSLWFAVLCTLATLSTTRMMMGCAGKSVDENDPAALYQEAEEDIKNDHFQLAIDKLRNVKNKFPYSRYALDAQIRIGDVLFMQESFGESAMAYESFRDLHPKHDRLPYVMYRIGEAYYKDTPGHISRDQGASQKAVDAYGEFIRRFPTDPKAEEARKALAESRETLASKELYIADFYRRREQPDAARGRYAKIVELYPDTQVAKDAQAKLLKLPPPTPRKPEPTPVTGS